VRKLYPVSRFLPTEPHFTSSVASYSACSTVLVNDRLRQGGDRLLGGLSFVPYRKKVYLARFTTSHCLAQRRQKEDAP